MNITALNNEVHMLFDCPFMVQYRNQCEIGRFKEVYRITQPQISSTKLYSLFLSDRMEFGSLKERILSLHHMYLAWSTEVGID